MQTVDLGNQDRRSGKRKRNETRRQVKGEHKAATGGGGERSSPGGRGESGTVGAGAGCSP